MINFKTDQDIINFVIANKENQRKIILNLGKHFCLIGATNNKGITRKLIDYTAQGNQINICFNRDKILEWIYIYNRQSNIADYIYKKENLNLTI
jgi:hypothetical protein